MKPREISLAEIRQQNFVREDVLTTFEDRFEREHKLKTAMALTNADHEPIRIVAKLDNGEVVEVFSDLIDFEDDYVEVKGGLGIPVAAILDVGV